MRLILISLLFLLTSCSHIVYTGKGRIPVEIHSTKVSDKVKIEFETVKTSLLWGLVPNRVHYELGDELFKDRVISIGNLIITEYQTPMDQVMMYLSLGLYVPLHVKVEGWGTKVKNDFE